MKKNTNKIVQLFGMLVAIIVLGLSMLVSQSLATDYSNFVKEPNGGDILYRGNSYTIIWDNLLLPPSTPLEIWLSKNEDSGISYVQKIADVTNSDHSYLWTVPFSLSESANYSVSVRAKNIAGAADTSNYSFAILDKNTVGSLQFISPLSNENVDDGKGRVIAWRSPLINSVSLRVVQGSNIFYDRLFSGNDLTDPTLVERNNSEMVIHVSWPTINGASGTYTIQVITNQTSITRDAMITRPSLALEAPKGGEIWQVNETRNIAWKSSDIGSLDLILHLDGKAHTTIARVNANQNIFAWKIPTNLPTDDGYAIQLKDVYSDRSAISGRFSIKNDAKPTSNALLKTRFDPRVWAIERSRRHWIPTLQLFDAYGYLWDNVRIVDKGELAYYPRAKVLRAHGDYKVYYITESGMKRHVPNPHVFLSYGNRWDDVIEILPQELDAYPNSTLIRAQGDMKVYYLENGVKRWIKTPQAFNKYHFNWSMIAPVNQTELMAYPNGTPIE